MLGRGALGNGGAAPTLGLDLAVDLVLDRVGFADVRKSGLATLSCRLDRASALPRSGRGRWIGVLPTLRPTLFEGFSDRCRTPPGVAPSASQIEARPLALSVEGQGGRGERGRRPRKGSRTLRPVTVGESRDLGKTGIAVWITDREARGFTVSFFVLPVAWGPGDGSARRWCPRRAR